MQLRTLKKLVENDNHDFRDKLKLLLTDPIYTPRYELSLEQERDLAFKRLQKLFQSGLVDVTDFEKDPRRIFALHEACGYINGSFTTKLTVQLNLFGGTVLKFADRKRWKDLISGISKLTSVGCFALTELGYGNNAVQMETEAVFDEDAKSFIINTPSHLAQKYWITNGYCHAHWAVVFAQLKVKGKNEGIHGFLVRIRNDDLSSVDGVEITDMGQKLGLNGVDNARLSFDNIMVPIDHLISNDSSFDASGNFSSKIKSKRQRFIKMADQLLSGRVCIAAMTISAAKISLLTAFRYSQKRRAVGADGKSSWPLMNFQLQRDALVPLLARTYGLMFGLNKVKNNFSFNNSSPRKIIECCAIKALITWHAENTASICRERCGGAGFLSENCFDEAIAGAHAGITAEGDNGVLMQKVSKELIGLLKPKDLVQLKAASLIEKVKLTNINSKGILKLLKTRRDRLLFQLAMTMQKAKWKSKDEVFKAWMQSESSTIQLLAKSWGECFAYEEFMYIVDNKTSDDPVLKNLLLLFGLHCIQQNGSWFLKENVISSRLYRKLEDKVSELACEITPSVSFLIDAFNIPESMIHAPIAKDYLKYHTIKDSSNNHVNRAKKKAEAVVNEMSPI